MRKMFLVSSMLITASLFLVSCGDPGAGNAGNKPANAANLANNAATAPAANAAAIETDIKKLLTDTSAALAKNDVTALEKIYDEKYTLVNTDGSVQGRADRLASIKSGETKFDTFAYDEITVRSNPEGTGAVVIARATATGMNKGKPVLSPIRVTQVWSKTKDGWKMVSGQATPITAAAAPAKADNSKMPEANKAANAAKPPPPAANK